MADMDPRTGKLAWLRIQCSCGYQVTWPRALIRRRCGDWMRPYDLRRRLRCTSCGAKGAPKVSLSGGHR